MNDQAFISGVFIVGVSDWWFTSIDDSCYMFLIKKNKFYRDLKSESFIA
jgi:hypothetical protein